MLSTLFDTFHLIDFNSKEKKSGLNAIVGEWSAVKKKERKREKGKGKREEGRRGSLE